MRLEPGALGDSPDVATANDVAIAFHGVQHDRLVTARAVDVDGVHAVASLADDDEGPTVVGLTVAAGSWERAGLLLLGWAQNRARPGQRLRVHLAQPADSAHGDLLRACGFFTDAGGGITCLAREVVPRPMDLFLVEHDPLWSAMFRERAAVLRQCLGPRARRIDHIGSTAVPGILAKPVIDIQITVDQLEPFDGLRARIADTGYSWRAENTELTKKYFRERDGERRTHIHVRLHGSFNAAFALLFREFLRSNRDAARRYEACKVDLADVLGGPDPHSYSRAKIPIVWEIMRDADEWAHEIGWQPEPSDA